MTLQGHSRLTSLLVFEATDSGSEKDHSDQRNHSTMKMNASASGKVLNECFNN